MDDKDKQIIDILLKSGREPASNISKKVGISIPTVTDRIKKMIDSEVITGFKAVINYRKLGCNVSALITIISESSSNFSEIVEKSRNTPEIIKCFATTGTGSHVMIVNTENTDSLEKILRNIQGWTGVKRTETQIILSSN